MINLLAMRNLVLGPKWLVIMIRRPASGNLNLGGLEQMISSTIMTEFLLYVLLIFTIDHNAIVSLKERQHTEPHKVATITASK